MLKILAIVSAAVLAVLVVTSMVDDPQEVSGPLAEGIQQQVAEMEGQGFDRVDFDRLAGATIVSFERDGEEMLSILDKAGNVIGNWQLVEAGSW